jgi:hypothetical protein
MNRMSPLELDILIKAHAHGGYELPNYPAQTKAGEWLVEVGLMRFTSQGKQKVVLTELGAAHLFQILSLPFPTAEVVIKAASGSEINMEDDPFFSKYVS